MSRRRGQGFGHKEYRSGGSNMDANDRLLKGAKAFLWIGLAIFFAVCIVLLSTKDLILR